MNRTDEMTYIDVWQFSNTSRFVSSSSLICHQEQPRQGLGLKAKVQRDRQDPCHVSAET
jgi:hypothetical protein